MSRFIIFFFLVTIASCSTNSKVRDPNIEIVIEDGQSYTYDLFNNTYKVSRVFKRDTTIHFELSAKERKQIIDKYYDLELYVLKGSQRIEDNCMIMPKIYTTVKIKSKEGLQEIIVDEGCNNFKRSFVDKGRNVTSFLKFVDNILKNKAEIKVAPTSDIMYL